MSRAVPAEVEAKLLVPRSADLRALATLTGIGPWRLVPRGTVRLHTCYLDTSDFALARQGVALRVRRHGRRWELTAKWQGSVDGVIHRRPELTVPLPTAPRRPFQLTDPALAVPLAALVAGRPLRVVLISDIQRRLLDLMPMDAGGEGEVLAEVALDRVRLHGEEAGGPVQRYCELEIEQRAGDVADLEHVVALLRERFELVPSAETKFSLGMQLLHRFRLPDLRAKRPEPEDTVIEAARKLVGVQLEAIRAHDPGTRIGTDPEALHDMRVAVRRLRAIVRTLHDGFPAALGASLREDLRWLGRELGPVRDFDVQIERVTAFAAAVPPSLRTSFDEFLGHLRARRDAERRIMLTSLDGRRYQQLLLKLERFADGRTRVVKAEPGTRLAAELAAEKLTKTYRKVIRKGRAVGPLPTPEQLHELRIRAKRLRYVLEFFGSIAGKPAVRAARRLARLQDLLGAYNDSVTAASFVQAYVDGPGAEAPASAMLTLGAVVGNEIGRGERLRRRFARRWERFAGKRSARDIEAAVARLGELAQEAEAARTAPRRRDRRTVTAASGSGAGGAGGE